MFGNKELSVKVKELEERIKALEQRPAIAADGGGAVAHAWGTELRKRIEALEQRLDGPPTVGPRMGR